MYEYEYDFHTNHELTIPKQTYTKKGLCGLINLGNKCFMNSILQCLSHTLKMTDYFLSSKYLEDDPEKLNKRKQEYYLVMSYANLMKNVWETNQLIKPKSFVENMSKFVQKYFNLQQQDSHECLLYILDILHRGLSYEVSVEIVGEVKNDNDALMRLSLEKWKSFYEKQYSFIIETFNGLFYSAIQCQNCAYKDDVFEPFNCLSLDVPETTQSVSLQDCLDKYFTDRETIQSWNCEKCKQQGCHKNEKIWTLPNYLIIHLKRFTNTGDKIYTHVEYPLDNLKLTQYVASSKNDPNNYIYSLYAVNYHSGDMNGGHYWSVCKNLDGNWYLFNDGNVSKFHKTSDILTKDSYILFYSRKFIRNPIQI